MNSERLQRNLENAGEESTLLKESNAQVSLCTDLITTTIYYCIVASEILYLHA